MYSIEERDKYTEIWSNVPEYRNWSPGMENVQRFLNVLEPSRVDKTLLDIGCGEGKAGLEFEKLGFKVNWIDITDAALSQDVPRDKFLQGPLWDISVFPISDYGFCCDVMEHIPSEYSMLCLHNIINSCRTTWFNIALVPDSFGQTIGKPLHLTVRPFAWWRDQFVELGGVVVDARDLGGSGLYVVRR